MKMSRCITVAGDTIEEHKGFGRTLRAAMDKGEFVLHYQPQLDYAGNLTGAEALIRWRCKGDQLVLPSNFIELAERTGHIVELGAWVLFSACKQLAIWQRQPRTKHLTVAVNVSPRQLSEPGFVKMAIAAIEITGADPRLLKLELTEGWPVADIEGAAAKMKVLRARGVSFSLDDFGTGHSSLVYLMELPLDQLKIDQSFVRNLTTSDTNATIVRSTIKLAHGLGLEVIAEGVETLEQRDLLARSGCFNYQGFLYHRALSAADFYQFARCHVRLCRRRRAWQRKSNALAVRRISARAPVRSAHSLRCHIAPTRPERRHECIASKMISCSPCCKYGNRR